jgi:hypothetical protein
MRDKSQQVQTRASKHCAFCDGSFCLIRHHLWRAPVCSRKCVDGLKARRDSDRNWLLRCYPPDNFSS